MSYVSDMLDAHELALRCWIAADMSDHSRSAYRYDGPLPWSHQALVQEGWVQRAIANSSSPFEEDDSAAKTALFEGAFELREDAVRSALGDREGVPDAAVALVARSIVLTRPEVLPTGGSRDFDDLVKYNGGYNTSRKVQAVLDWGCCAVVADSGHVSIPDLVDVGAIPDDTLYFLFMPSTSRPCMSALVSAVEAGVLFAGSLDEMDSAAGRAVLAVADDKDAEHGLLAPYDWPPLLLGRAEVTDLGTRDIGGRNLAAARAYFRPYPEMPERLGRLIEEGRLVHRVMSVDETGTIARFAADTPELVFVGGKEGFFEAFPSVLYAMSLGRMPDEDGLALMARFSHDWRSYWTFSPARDFEATLDGWLLEHGEGDFRDFYARMEEWAAGLGRLWCDIEENTYPGEPVESKVKSMLDLGAGGEMAARIDSLVAGVDADDVMAGIEPITL